MPPAMALPGGACEDSPGMAAVGQGCTDGDCQRGLEGMQGEVELVQRGRFGEVVERGCSLFVT